MSSSPFTFSMLPLLLLPLASAMVNGATGTGGAMASKTSSYVPYPTTGKNATMSGGPDLTGPALPTDKPYPALAGACQPGQIYCKSPTEYQDCDQNGQYLPALRPVSPGTKCYVPVKGSTGGSGNSPGRIDGDSPQPDPNGPQVAGCTMGVTLVCYTDTTYGLCNKGVPTSELPVAAGTICKDNHIVGAANSAMSVSKSMSMAMPTAGGTAVGSAWMPRPSSGDWDRKMKRDVQKFRQARKAKGKKVKRVEKQEEEKKEE